METMFSQRETGGGGANMDSETTVILQRPTRATSEAHNRTAVTTPSRTSRTETTAVFVGRASFQMVPALHAGRQTRAEAPVEPKPEPKVMVATPPPAVIVLEEALMQPAATPSQAVPALRQAPTSGTVLRLFSPAEVTEPIQTRVRSARARRVVTP